MTRSDRCSSSSAATGSRTLTLNRPAKRNALSVALRDAISDALDELARRRCDQGVVITGAGPVFSAGFDLSEFDAPPTTTRSAASSGRRATATTTPCCASRSRRSPRVNGPALAGGFDLAILCDLRIASTTARFAHPERTFGDVVYGPLHDLVGGAVARELTIGGRELTADEALAVHLVGEVVAPDALATPRRDAIVDPHLRRAPRRADAHEGQSPRAGRLRRRSATLDPRRL